MNTEKQVDDLRAKLYEHKKREDIAKKRRDLIKAEYKLDELKARLKKRNEDHIAAIKKMNGFENENPVLQKELAIEIKELDNTIDRLRNDTLK